jgi:vacuolar-type H+-ATPase subunit H
MSITETTLNTIHNRLQELSNEATPEQLAYLAKAFETIVSNGKMIDIVHLADQKLDELLAKAEEYLTELKANKETYIADWDESKNEVIDAINNSTSQRLSAINTAANTRKTELINLTNNFNSVNDVPSGSSICAEISKESQKRKFIQDDALPFVFGILSRYNDCYGAGNFTTDLDKWSSANADVMLQLLAGCHSYTTEYAGFYKEPSLCFLQGLYGNFIQKEMYLKYASSTSMYLYPYAALGVFFIKNTTDSDIATAINFGGASYWSSGYEGASMWCGIPNNVDKTVDWQNLFSYVASSTNFNSSASFVVPAQTTVAILFYTSSYYYTSTNSFYVQFLHWYVYGVRSLTLRPGLEIDIDKTIKAWQCKGFTKTHDLWK